MDSGAAEDENLDPRSEPAVSREKMNWCQLRTDLFTFRKNSTKMDATKMNSEVKNIIAPMMGLRCCRKRANENAGLSLGFGVGIPHGNNRLNDTFYCEWEIGNFYGSWRIGKAGKILCASQDIWEDPVSLQNQLNELELGQIVSLDQLTDLDVRAQFSNGAFADFLATTSDDDELFHIFCPRNIYIEFSRDGNWRIGESNKPRAHI